jgi:hypothetical protein
MAYSSGGGLPNIERLFIKYFIVPTCRIFFTWNIALRLLKREVKIIKALVESVEPNLLQKQILIDRAFAIEDHSRDFSINMALEHLTITNGAIMGVIDTLSQEKEFTKEISIEIVKPKENKQNQLDEYLALMDRYFVFIENHNKKYSKVTKRHPWFLEFNNFDWSIFNYMHAFIHRRHIEAIISKLGESNE